MFSKRLALLTVLFMVVSGCGLNLGEKTPKKAPPFYSGQGFSCVGKIPEHFDKYVNDQLSNEEITVFVNCLQKAFTTFAQLTRGDNVTSYAPDEIRNFLHEFFLGDRRISDSLMQEFMVLKQALLGGSPESISREELYKAVEMLEELRVEAIRLKPHLKVLNPRLAIKQSPVDLGQKLLEANSTLNTTISVISRRLESNQRIYPLANLEKLLTEFRAFVGWEKHFQQALPVAKWVNFLRVFRQLTVAPDDSNVVQGSDWAPMLKAFSRWYVVFLQYEVGVKDRPVMHGVGLQNSVRLAQETFDLLRHCISRQEGLTISFKQMDELIQAMHALRWIPPAIRAESVSSAVKAVVGRMLGAPDIPASLRASQGLDLRNVARAEELFLRWAYVQMDLDAQSGPREGSDPQVVIPTLQPSMPIRAFLDRNLRGQILGLKSSDWDEFLKVKSYVRPLFLDGSQRVMLVSNADMPGYGLRHSFHNLSYMNLARAATSLVFRGYAEKSDSSIGWDAGITGVEMQRFYEDFRSVGIDLKLIDERNTSAGSRSFIEGNLFTYGADGLISEDGTVRSRLNFRETMELFSFLYSGGSMAMDFYQRLGGVCEKGPLDINGRPKLARSCVVESLPGLFFEFATNMPDLLNYLRASTPEVIQDYSRTMLETAFSPTYSNVDWVEMNELSVLAVVLHYAEAVMTRYDKNRDGLLTNNEIDEAAVVFMGFIKKFAKDTKDQNLSDGQAIGAFYYILTYREMPQGFWDIFWPTYISTESLSLNRSDLSTVFRVIIAKLFDAAKTPDQIDAPDMIPLVMPCQGTDMVMPANCFAPSINP